jgi:hypothetical protein
MRSSGILPMDDDLRKLANSTPPDYFLRAIHLTDLIVMGAAALLLFRLRKSAVAACGITVTLEVVLWLLPVISGDFTRMGFSDWAIHRALIIGSVFSLMLPFAIFLYARRLREKGVLD